MKYTFTIAGSGIGYKGGNYKSEFPMAAAKKAGRQLFLKLKKKDFAKYKNKTTIKFILRQRIVGSPGKTYAYEVKRNKLKKPIIFKKGDVEIKIEFEYKVTIIKMNDKDATRMTGGSCSIMSGGGEGEGEVGSDDEGDGEGDGGDEYNGEVSDGGSEDGIFEGG